MLKCLPTILAGALLVAAAHAQCLPAPTGTSVTPTLLNWSVNFTTSYTPDDEGLTSPPITFTAFPSFPMAGAVGTLDQLWVNSNGDLYLTDSTLALTNVVGGASIGMSTLTELRGSVAGASARIAVLGDDHEASVVAGAAWNITVDQTVPGEVRICFTDLTRFANTTDRYSFSCTLFGTGAVRMDYGTIPSVTDTRIVGVSIGNQVGSTSSPSLDLSAGADSGTEGLIHQLFGASVPFDLGNKSILFVPNGTGGYVTSVLCDIPAASHTVYGNGCYETPETTLYQQFVDQASAKAALDGNALNYTPVVDGYSIAWQAGGGAAFIAPSAGATTVPIFASEGTANITPSGPFPGPTGPIPTINVAENGVITMASTPNIVDTTPSGTDLVSTSSPSLAFYSWRNFDLGAVGGGTIKYEEVLVGPDTVLVVTWDGVEANPTTSVNPSTFQFQFNLVTGAVKQVWVTWDSSTSTDDVVVGCTLAGPSINPGSQTLSALTTPAEILDILGQPSLAQLFADSPTAKAALDGNRMRCVPTASGYTLSWVPGGAAAYIAPSGGASTPFFAANGNVQITPSIAVPTPFGPEPTVSVSENGILTMAATANNGTDTTPSTTDMTGSAAPDLAFYSWRDFTLAEAGSGPIQYEEVTVGPDTILVVTWAGVEVAPTTSGTPSTWQYQVNLTNGTVDILWVSWDPSTSTSDTMVGVTLPGTTATTPDTDVNPGSVTLSAALPFTLTPLLAMAPLALSASPPPVFTIGGPSVPITYQVDNLRDLSPFVPGFYLATLVFSFNPPIIPGGLDLTLVGIDAPGCNLLVGSLDVLYSISPTATSHGEVIVVPQPLAPGTSFYVQAANFIIPNSLPNGQNGFGLTVSNGVQSYFQLFP